MNTSLHRASRRARLIGVAAAALLALTACGSDSSDSGGDDTQTVDGIVGTREIPDFGTVLTDADGNTLYMTDAESDGSVACVDACTDFWPPVAATQSDLPSDVEGVDGTFGLVDRPDGTEQLTLDGNPLYTFADDSGPGSFTGDGFEDDFQGTHFVWHAVTTDGSTPPSDEGGGYTY
jgi:predicted lipoprotein with Yx(FWY)xxD motif